MGKIASIPLSIKPVERTHRYHGEIYAALRNRNVRRDQELMLDRIQAIHDNLEALIRENVQEANEMEE